MHGNLKTDQNNKKKHLVYCLSKRFLYLRRYNKLFDLLPVPTLRIVPCQNFTFCFVKVLSGSAWIRIPHCLASLRRFGIALKPMRIHNTDCFIIVSFLFLHCFRAPVNGKMMRHVMMSLLFY
jgi:hypothetical protein